MSERCIGTLICWFASSLVLSAQSAQLHLQRVVGVASENGIVAIDGNTVSSFSTANIRLQDAKNLRWKLANKKDGSVSLRVEGTGWREHNALPISSANTFALCGPLNQVDVGSADQNVRATLPSESKVKSLVPLYDDLSLVLYSVSRKTVRYDIWVGVVQRKASGGYSPVTKDLATDVGNFCGVQRGDGGAFFVFADEPSGSSDFRAVYAYALENKSQAKQ